jgi:predicted MPP superfamily phosphohydrolase
MNLVIVHLSDIHFKQDTDPILKRTEPLLASLRPHLAHAEAIVLAITGDIAQSGSANEYKLATRFLSDLKSRLKREVKCPTHTILAPGNHDCDFSGDQSTRQLVVDAVLKHPGTLPSGYIQTATKIQAEYFRFRASQETKDIKVLDEKLWTTYSLVVGGFNVAFDAINASWMSTRHEQQGGLLFPFEVFQKPIPESVDLRICLMHHPLNWYSQSNYRAFRSFLHRRSDLILSGHEHEGAGREIEDSEDGNCIYIDGEALQTSNISHSAFNILLINTATREYRYETMKFRGGRYEPQKQTQWEHFRPIKKKISPKLNFSEIFLRELRDPGATLKHFSGRELTLDDIFVYPDFDDRSEKLPERERARAPRLNASFLAKAEKLSQDILIYGDDESGKTRLIYKLACDYHSQGYYPLILRGDKIKSANPETVAAEITAAVKYQYGSEQIIAFNQSPKVEKILLLDDFDRAPLNAERKASLIAEVKRHFERVLVTVGENFEVSKLFGGENLLVLSEMQSLKILPLGHARRLELIRKWNKIGVSEGTTENEFLKSCDEAEKLIESTKLRYVASTNPIFVLSLLQAAASGVTSEMHNSSFAHYYYFLIIGALEKIQVGKQDFNTVLSACTHLSWFIRKHGDNQHVTLWQYKSFIRVYSEEWTNTDGDKLLTTLIESKLMKLDGEALSFTYPYSYYYFLGKYTSISQDQADVKEYVNYCLKHLYARECANTLLFLAHHSGNSTVLDGVTAAIDNRFTEKRPATLEHDDVAAIANLLAHAPAVRYRGEVKPNDFRQRHAEKQDEYDSGDGLRDTPNESEKDLVQEIIGLLKAIEISGTLLTHQFANYDRNTKNAAIRSIFDGAMRAVKVFHSHFESVDQLVKSLSTRFSEKQSKSVEQIEKKIRNEIALLLKAGTTSLVMRAAANLRSRDLKDNVKQVVEDNPTCANRLIKIAQDLQHPTRLPRLEIERLRRGENLNPAVMGVLQLLLLQRLYMYETDHDDKDWAMSVFELGGERTVVEMKQQRHRPPKRLT